MILSILGIIALDSCSRGGNGEADKEETAKIVKAFLIENGLVTEKYAEDPAFLTDEYNRTHSLTETNFRWQHAQGGDTVLADSAYVQIDECVYNGSFPYRSFIVEERVFADYKAQNPGVRHFKFCFGMARDTTTHQLDRQKRTVVVLAVDSSGNYISLRYPGVPGRYVYDQIAPCPYDCGPSIGVFSISDCDYIDTTRFGCMVSINTK